MDAPKDLLSMAEEILKKREQEKKIVKKWLAAEKKASRDRRDLLKKNYRVSMARAKFILDWIKNFTKSADGKTILRARVMIRIFVATFWEGEPRPKTQSSTTFAYIELGVNGGLAYCEKYKWHPAHEMRKWVLPIRPTSLARFFHPQYLEEWEAAIRSGDVWKYIKNSL